MMFMYFIREELWQVETSWWRSRGLLNYRRFIIGCKFDTNYTNTTRKGGSFPTRKEQNYDSFWCAEHVSGTWAAHYSVCWVFVILDACYFRQAECTKHWLNWVNANARRDALIYSRARWPECQCWTPSSTLGGSPSSVALSLVFFTRFDLGCMRYLGRGHFAAYRM
jgi:hypothetical protein